SGDEDCRADHEGTGPFGSVGPPSSRRIEVRTRIAPSPTRNRGHRTRQPWLQPGTTVSTSAIAPNRISTAPTTVVIRPAPTAPPLGPERWRWTGPPAGPSAGMPAATVAASCAA